MTDTSPPHSLSGHNPFDDPRPKRNKGFGIALLIAIIFHSALAVYLWKSKFEPQFKEYSDDVTDVALIKPVPPPEMCATTAERRCTFTMVPRLMAKARSTRCPMRRPKPEVCRNTPEALRLTALHRRRRPPGIMM